MEILPLIPEIQALVPAGQLESRTSRLPFTAGQILQATVSAQTTPHLFTLAIGGQELPVESSAALQPGQTLSVQVTAVSPQLQLQIVDHASTNQRITAALHFMTSQGKAFAQIPSLADAVPQSSQLSTGSQQVLQQMRTNLIGLTAGNSQAGALLQQIGTTLQSPPLATGEGPSTNTAKALGHLLQQLADLPDISPQLRENITPFAQALLMAKGSLATVLAQAAFPALTPAAVEKQASQLSDLLQQMGQMNPAVQMLLQPILEQLGQYSGFREYRFGEQLLSLLIRVGIEAGTSPEVSTDGRLLQQTLHRMGMNLEQLLAQGNMREAAATLKFALLELSNLSTTNDSQVQRIDDLLGTIQLSQLMQLRLSAESLFFLPLPFPYLQSGFLLIDPGKKGEHDENKKKKRRLGEEEVSMYLQLEGLGHLQITLHQDKDQIALTFYSQDTERAKFLGQYRDELAHMLTTGTLYSAHFLIGAKEPVKILIEKILHASTGMVNTLA